MKLILTGVTGAAGIQIFRTAVQDAAITNITVLSRRVLPSWMDIPENNKTEVVVLQDFMNYSPELSTRLADHDACVWALGKSSVGLSDEEYTRITYDYTMSFINAIQDGGVRERAKEPFKFVFVSGEGADQTTKSKLKFARIKGRTEKDLLELPSSSGIKSSILRPAYFFPSQNHPSDRLNIRSTSARFADRVMAPVFSTLLPSMYTKIEGLGTFAVEVAKGRWGEENLFRNTRMTELLKAMEKPDSGHQEL